MCGIFGVVGDDPAAPIICAGLKRLEYRGYDSAGIATLVDGVLERRRAEGKLANLEARLADEPLAGTVGIGHIRWATHGAPTENNAHPHATDRVAVVHNGIIENFSELRTELQAAGHRFVSDTDSEVVAHLVTGFLDHMTPAEAVSATLARLEGAFALGLVFAGEDDLIVGVRRGAPLAIGFGDGINYFGSDALALASATKRITYLEEGDWAEVRRNSVTVHDAEGNEVTREVRDTEVDSALISKGNHAHFMAKEIFEQPTVIGDTLGTYFNHLSGAITLPNLPFDLGAINRVTIVACGTAFYAGMVAKYWFEQIAGVDVAADIASEFRYRDAALPEGGLALFISQSGETADTLAALRHAKEHGQHIMAIVNVPESTIEREADVVLPTHAGPEIGVASTKAFTCQLTVLACLAIAMGVARGAIAREREAELTHAISEVPARAAEVLNHDQAIRELARDMAHVRGVLYLGRGTSYPIALEGALKLKEISYLHAEGYAAGEMKHGPIALIDDQVPVIIIAPHDRLFEKTRSNMEEVIARGGKVVLLSDGSGLKERYPGVWATIELPKVDPFVAPILYAIPVQLLAYHVAVIKGTDVDRPRNLAKSVTVE